MQTAASTTVDPGNRERVGAGLTAGRVAAPSAVMADHPDTPEPTPTPAAVTLTGLTKAYPGVVALAGVTCEVPAGATYGLIGPNGAGKTTLLDTIAGLRHPDTGTVEVAGRVAVVADTPRFEQWLTPTEILTIGATIAGVDVNPDQVLATVGLSDVAHRRSDGFSRGMAQRLGIAAALATDPAVLICDEPTAALDPTGRRDINDVLVAAAQDRTVIISTHNLTDAAGLCTHVGVLAAGTLRYSGPISGVLDGAASTMHIEAVGAPEGLEAFTAAVAAAPWVAEVRTYGAGRLWVRTGDLAAARHAVVALAADTAVGLAALGSGTDLEAAYRHLTDTSGADQ